MEDFVRKTLEVGDINSLPLATSKELDLVADKEGRIFIKIKNTFKEMLFDDYKQVIAQILDDIIELRDYDQFLAKEIKAIQDKLPQIQENKTAIEGLVNDVASLASRLSTLEPQLSGMDIRIKDLETELSALGDVELVRATLDQHTGQIADLDTKTASIKNDLTDLDTKVGNQETTLTTLDTKIQTEIDTQVSINATQNNRLNTLESKVVDTTWRDVTPIEPYTATKQIQVKRQNGVVYMRGALAHNATNGDCFTLPEGFRPPSSGGYEYHYLLPGQSNTQTDAAKIYVRPSGLCSIVSKSGTTPIFLEPITFSIT